MREFQDRRRFRRFFHSRYAIGVLILVLVLAAQAVWGIYNKYQKSEELSQRMSANLSELQDRRQKLVSLNASLETEQGREREIRDRFGVVREGEQTVIIVENRSGDGGITPLPERSVWQAFLDLFR